MSLEAEFWVAVAFAIFLGILARAGVHRTVLAALDRRRDTIRSELDEAKASGGRQRRCCVMLTANGVRRQTKSIQVIDDARAQARRLIAEAKAGTEDFVRRGTRLAEARIAQAERQAVADVRAMVAEVAVSAAEKVLIHSVNGEAAERIFHRGIEAVKANLGNSS